MGQLRAIRTLNALQQGTLSSAQLETLLTTGSQLGEWSGLMQSQGQCNRLAASSTAMTAVAASSTARLSFWNSDPALTAAAGSSAALAAFRAAPGYAVNSFAENNGDGTLSTISNMATSNAKWILVGWSRSSTTGNAYISSASRRSGSAVGTLSGNPVSGSTAAANNVMALIGPATAYCDTISRTVYFGVLPV